MDCKTGRAIIYCSMSYRGVSLLLISMLLISQVLFGQQKYVFEQAKMGSPFTISIFANDSASASRAAFAAFHCADSLNLIFSDYIDSSELNRLNATSGQGRFVQVSSAMFDILKHSLKAARASNGSYDISMGPLVKLWRKARIEKILPNPDSVKGALLKVGYQYIHLDSVHQSLCLEKPGMQLDLGGIGKGYVAQAALNLITAEGFKSAMVNAGGNIVTGEAPPGKKGWRIGITVPNETGQIIPKLLLLENMCVATSGDIYQHLDINGLRYSHIIDPKTGVGLTLQRNVTVVASDGTTADWLSTACSILPAKKAFKLVSQFPQGAMLMTELKNGKLIQKGSAKFRAHFDN
jgi:thiamine biosynthesis lipoprotein